MSDVQKFVDTERAATFLGCSTRRIRTLLSQGRIAGKKEGVVWLVQWPMHISFGKRAPLRKFAAGGISNKNRSIPKESEV